MKYIFSIVFIISLLVVVFYFRFYPAASISGDYLIISYLIRDEFDTPSHREFVVFNYRKLKFVKSSI
ncbi:hypothetical protein PANI_CDS0049 [Maribacter phage Panino]